MKPASTEYLIYISSREETIYGQNISLEVYRQIMTGTDREFYDSLIEKTNLPLRAYQSFCLVRFTAIGHTLEQTVQLLVRSNSHLFHEEVTGFVFEAVGFLYFALVTKNRKADHDVAVSNFGRTTLEMGSGLHILVPELNA